MADSAGNRYRINYADNIGDGALNNDVSIMLVPEPGTWATFGLGAAAMVTRRRVISGRA